MPQEILTVIPARGGSKGIIGKNICEVNRIPLIAYTIYAAQDAATLNHHSLIVSTDDERIADVAQRCGANVFMHDPQLSVDGAPTFPVIRNALNVFDKQGTLFDATVVLRATSPLRTGKHVDEAVRFFWNTGADSVVSVYHDETADPVRLKYIDKNGKLTSLEQGEENMPVRRQSLKSIYRRNGAIYVSKADIVRAGSWFGADQRGYIMSEGVSLNINNADHLRMAEAWIRLYGPDYSNRYATK